MIASGTGATTITPGGGGQIEQTWVTAQAAKAAGVARIVKLGSLDAPRGVRTQVERWCEMSEDIVKSSGAEWTFLRPTWFDQDFTELYFAPALKKLGLLVAPMGEGLAGWIDCRDIAALAAIALTDGGHAGKAYTLTPQPGANDGATATPPRAPAPAAATAAASAMPAPAATPGAPDLRAVAMPSDDPTMITVEHWRRILDGELYAASSRVEWALLLRRTYGVDALRCPKCTAGMRVMATIPLPDAVKKILAHLALPTEPLPRARARDPTGQESFDFDAA